MEIKIQLLQTSERTSELTFAVHDSDIGIDPNEAEKLFQPFSQADVSTTRRFGGTGLGLVLSKRLAFLLGGDAVLTESIKGKGGTFTVTIDPRLDENREIRHQEKSLSSEKLKTHYLSRLCICDVY